MIEEIVLTQNSSRKTVVSTQWPGGPISHEVPSCEWRYLRLANAPPVFAMKNMRPFSFDMRREARPQPGTNLLSKFEKHIVVRSCHVR
jgi:hypothetical protein